MVTSQIIVSVETGWQSAEFKFIRSNVKCYLNSRERSRNVREELGLERIIQIIFNYRRLLYQHLELLTRYRLKQLSSIHTGWREMWVTSTEMGMEKVYRPIHCSEEEKRRRNRERCELSTISVFILAASVILVFLEE